MKYTYSLLFLFLMINVRAQQANRYTAQVFDDYNVYNNLIYAQVLERNARGVKESTALKLDFYEPSNDEATARPLIILFPDGNYVTAQKQQSDMVNWCKQMTMYGYTCACVDYRQGYPPNLIKGVERAMYKGVQDGRAAIRYIKEFERTFRIDTNQIFIGGKFSGADIALHIAFLDAEKERPNSSYQIESFGDLGCLDCSGNNFEHNIDVKAVINLEGRIYHPLITSNNKNIKVLNFVLEKQNESANADKAENLQSIYNTNFIYRFLKKKEIETTIHNFEVKNDISVNFELMSNFLLKNLQNQSSVPVGDEKVCMLSTSTVTIPIEKSVQVEWFVNNGTILYSDNKSAEIIWNKGIGESKVQVIETSVNGLKCAISKPLIVQVMSQPIIDFEVEYLSDNAIKIVDNSQYGNLLMIDFGNNEGAYQAELKSNTLFSYVEDGEYLITQTVEGPCGVSTQEIPVEINVPLSFMTSNLEEFANEIPVNIQRSENLFLPFSKLKEAKSISLRLFDVENKELLEREYEFVDKDVELIINSLKVGTYFLVFSTNKGIVVTKRIRIL